MDWTYHLLVCVGIFAARIVDVALGTLRMIAVVNGRRWLAWTLGFFEVLVWVLVVSHVIRTIDLEHWYYGVAYALGFASGCWVGIWFEQLLAHGEQAVRVFTRRGSELSPRLRGEGWGVTSFVGQGKDGPVEMLYITVKRKSVPRVTAMVREVDAAAFYVVDDVRYKSMTPSPAASALLK